MATSILLNLPPANILNISEAGFTQINKVFKLNLVRILVSDFVVVYDNNGKTAVARLVMLEPRSLIERRIIYWITKDAVNIPFDKILKWKHLK